ncbi:MAG: DrmB family protein [Thermodesulfobacteriota bacterium]
MTRGPVRRGQLISPFGPGAMMILPDGVSVICAGLDHWFKHESGGAENIDQREYQVDEWRLAARLNVEHFYLPPDHRRLRRYDPPTNGYLTVPFLRFPQWHYCTRCGLMRKIPLVTKERRIRCAECENRGWTRFIVQVPFVAMCDAGHIQDFPWIEWVYQSATPPEDPPPMRLISTGGMTLAGQKVIIDGGPERTLAGITNAYTDGTTQLSQTLDSSRTPFLCPGHRPWLGTEHGEGCGRPLRGTLRSAANVYFAQVHSSIYLPRNDDSTVAEVISLLEQPPLSTFVGILTGAGVSPEPSQLRKQFPELLTAYTDRQLQIAIETVCSNEASRQQSGRVPGDDAETGFRRQEYDTLVSEIDSDQLVLKPADLSKYKSEFSQYFANVTLVHKLRETRALSGFTRVFADTDRGLEYLQGMLRLTETEERWLPAYMVFGEGVLLTLNEQRLRQWETQSEIQNRVRPLVARYRNLRQFRHLQDRHIGPRYVLLHTLAHLLINRLTFECGYSSAALRERLYVSENHAAPMAGIMIYTAAGDAEGTLGGLVRMGKPGRLEPLLDRALSSARWCSADPVCMEMGQSGGQGPDSLNLAACHGCSLVPETACEEFNRLLDRGLVIGPFNNQTIGYFARSTEG